MPLYWLVYRRSNQISVVIEPGASLIHARMRAALLTFERVLINAGIGRISAREANRIRRDGGNDVNDPIQTYAIGLCCAAQRRPRCGRLRSPAPGGLRETAWHGKSESAAPQADEAEAR